MIGKKLKDLIALRDIKQVELARAVGISPSRLSNYLSDKREPNLEMLAKIATFLGVDVNYFAGIETVYRLAEEVTHTDSDNADTVTMPVKPLNAKKNSRPSM